MIFKQQQSIDLTINQNTSYEALVFDLTGVCFHYDIMTVIKSAGLGKILYYYLTHFNSPSVILMSLYEEIHRHDPKHCEKILYKGKPVPRCIVEGLLGTKTRQEIFVTLKKGCQEHAHVFASTFEQNLIEKFLQFSWSGAGDEAYKIYQPIVNLITKLRASGKYKLYVLSNLFNETYEHVLHTNPDFFALFDGIVISAHVQMIKPYKNIYEYLLQTYNIKPQQALFIDDQQENVTAAQELSMNGIVYNSLSQTIQELKQHGILL